LCIAYNGTPRSELIFAQELTTTESTFTKELVMMNITDKVVFKTNVVMKNGKREMVSEKWFGLFGSKF
jgi:hypothetical protein